MTYTTAQLKTIAKYYRAAAMLIDRLLKVPEKDRRDNGSPRARALIGKILKTQIDAANTLMPNIDAEAEMRRVAAILGKSTILQKPRGDC